MALAAPSAGTDRSIPVACWLFQIDLPGDPERPSAVAGYDSGLVLTFRPLNGCRLLASRGIGLPIDILFEAEHADDGCDRR